MNHHGPASLLPAGPPFTEEWSVKFIHLTDTHIVGRGAMLYGADPAQRLRLAVDSINSDHADAAFVIITGDLTHWGDDAAYAAFFGEIDRLVVPSKLMVGNHDDTPSLVRARPDLPRDISGFIQTTFETPHGRGLVLDTRTDGQPHGGYCECRREWLVARLEEDDAPVLIFMHHPPLDLGIAGMDAIRLLDDGPFADILRPHAARIRHIFFGHVHRAIFGTWLGIPFSCMRATNHQVAYDTQAGAECIPGSLEAPAYGVVTLSREAVVIHMQEFADRSPRFDLRPPAGKDPQDYALSMRHEGWSDL
jgi:3',5'-cyclic AMP phosphodiesterase CpdA